MYLSFQLDASKQLGIDLRKVHRVEPYQDVFRLPRQKPGVVGLFRSGDILVPVFDFRQILEGFVDKLYSLPHLVLFYGRETLNAFPAFVLDTIHDDCVMAENGLNVPFLDAYDLIYNDLRYHQLDFKTIEEHLNIP